MKFAAWSYYCTIAYRSKLEPGRLFETADAAQAFDRGKAADLVGGADAGELLEELRAGNFTLKMALELLAELAADPDPEDAARAA